MAIVFISPKERQKALLLGIIGLFVVVLIVIGLTVFLAKPKSVPVEKVFKAPKIEVNFEVLESNQIKNLTVFEKIEKEFNYWAKTKDGSDQQGKITATSSEEATATLEELGLSVVNLEEIKGGKENPFLPYYEVTPAPKKKTK